MTVRLQGTTDHDDAGPAPDSAFGYLLRRLRRAYGLTQSDLAERANFSVDYMRRLEWGTRHAPPATVDLIAYALGLTAGERDVLQATACGLDTRDLDPEKTSQLPRSRTTFIGRVEEKQGIVDLFRREDARAVVITGPAGVGKTRLAEEIAAELYGDFSGCLIFKGFDHRSEGTLHSVWIAGLGEVDESTPTLMVLDALGLVPSMELAWERILLALPQTRFLVTSRRRVHLPGALEWRLSPLTLPEGEASIPNMLRSESVALFVDRATSINPEFRLTGRNRSAVIDLCVERAGLPALIDRVASTVAREPELLEGPRFAASGLRLEERHDLDGMAERLTVQYGRLTEGAGLVLPSMSVFVESCSREALECVCELPSGRESVESGLAELERHNLIFEMGDGRFGMLGPIRLYGARKLDEMGWTEEACQRRAEFFVDLVESIEPELMGSTMAEGFSRLDADRANLVGTIDWCFQHGQDELGVRMVAALGFYWYLQGYLDEGLHWVELALERATPQGWGRRKLLDVASRITFARHDLDRWAEILEERLTLSAESGDLKEARTITRNLAWLAMWRGDFEKANEFLQSEHVRPNPHQSVGDYLRYLLSMGNLKRFQGHRTEAEEMHRDVVSMASRLPDHEVASIARLNLALALVEWEVLEDARVLFRELVAAQGNHGETRFVPHGLEGLAYVAMFKDEDVRGAALLLGAATKLRKTLGSPREPDSSELVEKIEPHIEGHGRLFRSGERMTLEQMVDLALEHGTGQEDEAEVIGVA